jgi:hypothetical protein
MTERSPDETRLTLTKLLIRAAGLGDQLHRALIEAEQIATAERWVGALGAIAPAAAAIGPLMDGLGSLMRRADACLGLAWWNELTERERSAWMFAAGDTGVAADAWEFYKRSKAGDPAGPPAATDSAAGVDRHGVGDSPHDAARFIVRDDLGDQHGDDDDRDDGV